jgi:hypothetical protein
MAVLPLPDSHAPLVSSSPFKWEHDNCDDALSWRTRPACQLPSKPQSTGFCAVRRPTHTPIAKQTRPNSRVRSDTRPHSLMKAVVMAARRLVWKLVAPKLSHNFSQIHANGSCKRGLPSVDKFLWIKRAPPKRGRSGWVEVRSTCCRHTRGAGIAAMRKRNLHEPLALLAQKVADGGKRRNGWKVNI